MTDMPLIPSVRQILPRFRRHGKKHSVYYNKETQSKLLHPIRRRQSDRRKFILNIKLEHRSNSDRRNQSNKRISTDKGLHVNTTA